MATSYNTVDELKRILNRDKFDGFIEDTELEAFLDEANKELHSIINRKFEKETFIVGYNDQDKLQRVFNTKLSPVNSIKRVTKNEEELTVVTDYTEDLEEGFIKVISTIQEQDIIQIVYTPEVYYLTELYLARLNILRTLNVENQEGETNPIVQNATKSYQQNLNRILKKSFVGSI